MAQTVHLYIRHQGTPTSLPFSSVQFYREGGVNDATFFRPSPAGDGTSEQFLARTGFYTRPTGTNLKFTLPRNAESALAIRNLRGLQGSQRPIPLSLLCNNEVIPGLLRTRNATVKQVADSGIDQEVTFVFA